MTQITANLMEETLQLNCSRVTVLASDGLTEKHFGHYALLKIFSLRSTSCVLNQTIKFWNSSEMLSIRLFFTIMKKRENSLRCLCVELNRGLWWSEFLIIILWLYKVCYDYFLLLLQEKNSTMFKQVAIVIHWDLPLLRNPFLKLSLNHFLIQ